VKEHQLIRAHRRFLIGVAALLLVASEYVGFAADELVRGYYFKDFHTRVPGAADIAISALALYLLLVAATGRWLIARAGGRHG